MIELNRSRNNVVLSRRAVLEEERKEARQQILDRLSPGVEVEGQISNIVDFGAFVDLDGIDGLIHISELCWSHVNHPSEVLEIGQKVNVKVLDVDRDRQRISLGLKQTQTDPWQRVIDETQQGDVVAGRITKVVTFGAFAEIVSGVEGLIHISELAEHHVENPREVVQQGEDVKVKIIEIDPDRRRLSLSLRRVEPDEPVKTIDLGPAGRRPRGRGARAGPVRRGVRRRSRRPPTSEPEAVAEPSPRWPRRRARARGCRGRARGCRGRARGRRGRARGRAMERRRPAVTSRSPRSSAPKPGDGTADEG